jgi:hypothetical protein
MAGSSGQYPETSGGYLEPEPGRWHLRGLSTSKLLDDS